MIVPHFKAKLLKLVAQCRAARVFAHNEVCLGQPHIFRAHDLECLGVLEHAILMDAGFVREGVLADNGLVELDREAAHGCHAARDVHDLGAVDAGLIGHDVIADLQGHDHFFESRIASAFTKAVDRALDLARTCFDSGEAVGGGHPQIVVTVGGKNHIVRAGHVFDQLADQFGALARGSIADRIRNVDRGGTAFDRDFDDAVEVIKFGPGCVHRRPLHVVAQVAGVGHGLLDPLGHFIHGEVRDRAVQRRRSDERVNARLFGVFHGLPTPVNIAQLRAGQATDDRVFRILCDGGNGIEIAVGRDGKSGLDDVDAHVIKQPGNLELFGMGHGCTGRLFAVAKGCVEDYDAILCHLSSLY